MTWYLNHKTHGNKPWAVQAEALKRSHHRNKYGFWMEMGLGKSPLALNEFIQLLNDDVVDLMVVIAPNSFKLDWVLLPEEWGVPYIASGLWPRDQLPEAARGYLYVINYEAVRSSNQRAFQEFLERFRCMLVIDESSKIANPSSDTTKAVIELAKRAVIVRELNGTPMTQSVMDYYGQLRALGELNGIKSTAFRARYADMGGYMGKQVKGIREENKEELYKMLERCTFRALKSDWRKDLPPQVFSIVHLEMTEKQRAHYREMLSDFFTTVSEVDVQAELVLTQMLRLQQISSCLAIDGERYKFIEKPENNYKLKAVLDLHASGSGKSIVVYTYKLSGDLIEESLRKEKLNPARIKGGMSPQELIREKQRFNEDPSCRVLVGQENATCMGHTLIGGEGNDACYRVIFYENSFSLRDRLQMQDRIHRGSQKETCDYYDLVISPIDEAVIQALTAKKNLADAVDAVTAAVKWEYGLK